MDNYLKLYKNHEEYDESQDKGVISHCIQEVHIHNDNSYNYGSEDSDPDVSDEHLTAGYFTEDGWEEDPDVN